MNKPFLLNFVTSTTLDLDAPLPPYNPEIQGRDAELIDPTNQMAGTRNYTTKHQTLTGWEDWDG